MKFYTDGQVLFSDLNIPDQFCGWKNVVHGGILSTILDETMGWAAICLLQKLIFTKSVSITFLKTVPTDTPITVSSRILAVKNQREAIMEGSIRSASGELLTEANGCFALMSIETIKQRTLLDSDTIEDFQAFFSDMTRIFSSQHRGESVAHI